MKKHFKKIIEPNAFKIGILFTFAFAYVCYLYYETPEYEIKNSNLLNVLHTINLKSTDFRFILRGPRPVSEKIALVTVDEEALKKIGRWPWPRIEIAQVIEELLKNGAKTIAFDSVFAEPEYNPMLKFIEKTKEFSSLPSSYQTFLNKELAEQNNDEKLATSIEAHADKVILGGFFEEYKSREPYYIFCNRIANKYHDNYIYLTSIDSNSKIYSDDSTSSNYTLPMKEIIENTISFAIENVKQTNPSSSSYDNATKVKSELQIFCEQFALRDPSFIKAMSPIWEETRKKYKEQVSLSFEDYMTGLDKFLYVDDLPKIDSLVMNIPEFTGVSKNFGYFNAFQDTDGTIRRTTLLALYNDIFVPSLGLKAIMTAQNQNVVVNFIKHPKRKGFKKISEISLFDPKTNEISVDYKVQSDSSIYINYAGPKYSYPHLSVAQLLSPGDDIEITQIVNKTPKHFKVKKSEWIKDKIFFFGATAIGIFDLRVTPFEENFPGLETHANVADNLLNNNFLRIDEREEYWMMAAIFTIGVVLSLLISKLGAVSGLITILATLSILYYGDKFFFFNNNILIRIMFPILFVTSTYVILTFYKYLTEERKKKELKGTFEKYVSPAIVNEILAHPENIQLGGRKEKISVMFSDVRGFTTISEKLDPRILSNVLSEYLTPMTRLVFENKGTLDKYMGDAIMAFFGAPITYADHAKYACNCALQMIEKLAVIQQEFEKKQYPKIDIGIGINTGDMSVGNMGSDIVRSYTVMGDAVNLGSRLEGITKQYGTRIIISEFTQSEIKNDGFVTREVDWVRVKGKLLPVKIFELISGAPLSGNQMDLIKYFEEGTRFYHARSFEKAIDAFNKALNAKPDDYASQVYLQRCQNYLQEMPPEDWDGVFEMKTK